MWLITNEEFVYFYNWVSRFWSSKCLFTYKLPAVFRKCSDPGSCRQHLALPAGAWVLGQFLAHLEIFAEGSTVVWGFQECHGPANASLQNERFSFGIEGPSPVEILKASPSPKHWAHAKEHIQEAGPDTGILWPICLLQSILETRNEALEKGTEKFRSVGSYCWKC